MNYIEPQFGGTGGAWGDRNRIHHWRFEDGKTPPNAGHPIKELILDPSPRGWYCWMYTKDDEGFRDWMAQCCPTAEVIHRFNSGDPMWTVYISDENEAMLFRLKWST
jgi:hypothetical protein